MTKELELAFEHIKKYYPEITMVVFSPDGRWIYMDNNFTAPLFDIDGMNISLLEDAADSIEILPSVFVTKDYFEYE